jgi:hypothetical protein
VPIPHLRNNLSFVIETEIGGLSLSTFFYHCFFSESLFDSHNVGLSDRSRRSERHEYCEASSSSSSPSIASVSEAGSEMVGDSAHTRAWRCHLTSPHLPHHHTPHSPHYPSPSTVERQRAVGCGLTHTSKFAFTCFRCIIF